MEVRMKIRVATAHAPQKVHDEDFSVIHRQSSPADLLAGKCRQAVEVYMNDLACEIQL